MNRTTVSLQSALRRCLPWNARKAGTGDSSGLSAAAGARGPDMTSGPRVPETRFLIQFYSNSILPLSRLNHSCRIYAAHCFIRGPPHLSDKGTVSCGNLLTSLGTQLRLWSGSIVTMPGSCPRAFLHFSNFLDTRVLDQDCISKESCHVGVGVDRDNRPRYLIDYLLPVILAAHILDAMWMSVSSPFHQRPWRTVSHQEDCTSKESCHVVFCCIPGVVSHPRRKV